MRIASVLAVTLLATISVARAEHAQAAIQNYQLNIPRQSLDSALKDLAQQTGLQIGRFSARIDGSAMVGPVLGDQTPVQALKILLNNTGLEYEIVSDTTIAIYNPKDATSTQFNSSPHGSEEGPGEEASSGSDSKEAGKKTSQDFRVSQMDQNAAGPKEVNNQNSGNKEEGLAEIIVTAEKRESSLQRTAISITAVTGEDLQRSGITSLQAVIEQTPGISFRTNGGPGQVEIEMRGMTSTGGESPTVGFYLDEVPITPPAQAVSGKVVLDPNLFDLARVEVLRGPQGTLYGAGSMGGTVRLITNAPDPNNFYINSRVTFGDTHDGSFNHSEDSAVNLPLVDERIALRIVGSYSYTSGWIDRIVLNPFPLPTNPNPACGPVYGCTRGNVVAAPVQSDYHDVNDVVTTGARASLLMQLTDRLSVEPSVLYQRTSAGGPALYDSDPGTMAHYEVGDVPEPISDTFLLYSNLIKYHFDPIDVTSVTAFWRRNQVQQQDDAEQLQEVFETPAYSAAAGGLGSTPLYELDSSHQFSQELRVSTNWDSPWRGIVGGFYSDFYSLLDVSQDMPGAQAVLGSSTIVSQYQPTRIKQYAIFTEWSYALSSEWKATGGLRRYKYQSQLGVDDFGDVLGNDAADPITSFNKTSEVGYNPKFNLAYTPTADELLYATIAKGYRPGGANGAVPLSGSTSCVTELAALGRTSAPASFGSDNVWSYELGNKLQLDDRRYLVDASVYLERWNKVQEQVELNPCGFFFTDNQGTADVYGGEIEVSARIIRGLTVLTNGGYTHAALTQNIPESGGVAGAQLQNVPKVTGTLAVEYSTPLGPLYNGIVRLSDNYVGPRNDAFGPLPGYSLANFRFGVTRDEWAVNLFVNNLVDRRVYLSNAISLSVATPLYLRVATNQPRTLGVEFTFRH